MARGKAEGTGGLGAANCHFTAELVSFYSLMALLSERIFRHGDSP